MADDQWQSRSHGEIVSLLGALSSDAAHEEAQRWNNVSQAVSDSIDTAMATRQKLLDNTIWDGKTAEAAYTRVDGFYKEAADPQSGLAAEAGKISQAALQDGETLIVASRVAQNYPELGSGAPTERKKEELEAIRAEAQRMYTSPLSGATRPEITDEAGQQQLGAIPGGGNANGTGGGTTGGGSGAANLQPPSGAEGLANRDTKPQLAGGDGQQSGAGQGGGQGAGAGGGAPGGGQGSGGAGSGPPLGGAKDSASGLPSGATTAAGFSPSTTGTETGAGGGPGAGAAGGGPDGSSALRGGAGLPGGAASGTGPAGVNPAAVGAAGVRGVGGQMGVMGGAGAHGKGDRGADDEGGKPIPDILMNVDNGNELFGEPVKASPGVIGDWTEQEEMAKKKQEAEVRRYKSMGWDLKWE